MELLFQCFLQAAPHPSEQCIAFIEGTSWEVLFARIIVSALILIYCLLPGTWKAFGIPG